MPTREAAPRPKRNPSENVNAPGGKSKARAALKCIVPVMITASVVSNVPIHRLTVIVPIEVMRRYSSTILMTPTAAATSNVARGVMPVQM